MAETPITRPHQLQWPLSEQTVEDLNATLDDIYELLKQRRAAASPDHTLLNVVHTDTNPADEVDGDLIVGQDGAFARLPLGDEGDHLQVLAGEPAWDSDGSTLTDLDADEITSGTLDPARLALSGVAAGTYGDAAHVLTLTLDDKGRVTDAFEILIAVPPAPHTLLSTTHYDTEAAAPTLGDLIVAQNAGAIDADAFWLDGQPFDCVPNANDAGAEAFWKDGLPDSGMVSTGDVTWARKAVGTVGYVLTAGATGPDWQPASGGGQGASVYRSGNVALPDRTATPIPLSVVVTDDSSFWSVGSPTRFTVPTGKAGWYAIVGQVSFLGGTGRRVWARIYVNSAERASSGGDNMIVQAVALIKLAAADYVELYAYAEQDVPGTMETVIGGSASTLLEMVRVG